jgi:hypothetical protein
VASEADALRALAGALAPQEDEPDAGDHLRDPRLAEGFHGELVGLDGRQAEPPDRPEAYGRAKEVPEGACRSELAAPRAEVHAGEHDLRVPRPERRERPGIEISAAVMADLEDGQNAACQSAHEWIRQGLVDAIAPMAYTNETGRFDRFCRSFQDPEIRQKVWLGVLADPHKNGSAARQVRLATSKKYKTVAIFAYEYLFPNHKSSALAKKFYQAFTSKETHQ